MSIMGKRTLETEGMRREGLTHTPRLPPFPRPGCDEHLSVSPMMRFSRARKNAPHVNAGVTCGSTLLALAPLPSLQASRAALAASAPCLRAAPRSVPKNVRPVERPSCRARGLHSSQLPAAVCGERLLTRRKGLRSWSAASRMLHGKSCGGSPRGGFRLSDPLRPGASGRTSNGEGRPRSRA